MLPGSGVRAQLELTLDRLQTDHVELYALHRDNPAVPAAEFIEGFGGAAGGGPDRAIWRVKLEPGAH